MRTTHRLAGWHLAGVLLLLPVAAAAQDVTEPGVWFISPMAGPSLDPDGRAGTMLGGAVGHHLTARVTAEAEVTHALDPVDDPDVDSTLTTAVASLLYHFGEAQFRPYVAAGVGVGRYSLQVTVPPADVGSTALAFTLGGGVTWPVSSRVLVRGDFRYINFTRETAPDPGDLVIVDDVPTTWRFAGGLLIRIGG
jgi:hypothetical protein